MLNDEEKEAIEVLNHFNPVDCGREDTQAIETILNLIKKQSKVIVGLIKVSKECIEEKFNNDQKWEDKIKAKIEELDKEEKQQLKGTKGQDRYAIKQEYMYKRSGLQSLLEKE